jgi:hypothetical protein
MSTIRDAKKKRAGSNDLAIRVTAGEHIGVNKTVIRALENPDYLSFWWGADGKVIGIGRFDDSTDLSIAVPSYFYSTRKGAKIWHMKLMREIQAFTGWKDKSVHLLIGEFVPELRMVIFRTEKENSLYE